MGVGSTVGKIREEKSLFINELVHAYMKCLLTIPTTDRVLRQVPKRISHDPCTEELEILLRNKVNTFFKWIVYAIDWMFVSPQIHMLKPNLQCGASEAMKVEPSWWDQCIYERPRIAPWPLLPWEDTARRQLSVNQEGGPHRALLTSANTLILDFNNL